MIHLDLFSGIGGASIAVDEVFGKNNVTHIFCDNEPFAQAILKKHWPDSPVIGDIREFKKESFITNATNSGRGKSSRGGTYPFGLCDRESPFILTGGFPCQPFSQAGRRKGTDDDRYLWPEMLRVIREFKPQWVIGENVAGLLTWDEGVVLEQVCLDLEGEGYEVQPFVIPAVAVNAPHRRDRVWIVARHTDSNGRTGGNEKIDATKGGQPTFDNLAGRHSENSDDASLTDIERRNDRSNHREERHVSADERIATESKPEWQGRERGIGEIGADASDTANKRLERSAGASIKDGSDGCPSESGRDSWNENWLEVATRLCTLDDGLPNGLVRPKGWRNAALKGAGNAWVPQVAIEIMKGIKAIDKQRAVE
jgi:DNA (cytosine-5)-methyltransferase 1